MARGLDELLQFLLEEIALSGQQGSTILDVLDFIHLFYNSSKNERASSNTGHEQIPDLGEPTIDRAFQEQVWKWLTKHPDIRVGKDGKENRISLPAASAQHSSPMPPADHGPILDTSSSDPGSSLKLHQDVLSLESSQLVSIKAGHGSRIFVSEERMWLAICGHPKDATKVFDTEFALLSLIATHRHSGILQGDLVRHSGQDKRSVPKRTDTLRDKGYIEKRVTHVRGVKTSRLILRRFTSNASSDSGENLPTVTGQFGKSDDEFIDYHLMIHSLFSILKQKTIITREDLKSQLKMMSRWHVRILARVLRRFEFTGCLKKVKAASEISKAAQYHFNCIKFIREPSAQDLKAFYSSDSLSVRSRPIGDGEADEDDQEDGESTRTDPSCGSHKNQLEEIGRPLPQWNPDRLLPNMLHNLIDSAGIGGLTNKAGDLVKAPRRVWLTWVQEIRMSVFGPFLRRPLENLLARFTSVWFQSQPFVLRHLSMIRDIVLSGTVPLYVHYSFSNFQKRVDSGKAFWEAVKTPVANNSGIMKQSPSEEMPTDDAESEFDDFGFPAGHDPSCQHNGARASLGQALLSARPKNLPFNRGDPIIRRQPSGAYVVRYDAHINRIKTTTPSIQCTPVEARGSVRHNSSRSLEKASQPQNSQNKTLGRPRKFLRGTETFWQGQFDMARALTVPRNSKLAKSKRGMMTNAAGLTIFAQRPPQFDTTLVQALERGMPVPAHPQQIAQKWVDETLAVLHREAPGSYVTPRGVRVQGRKRPGETSRLLIVRSPRLMKSNSNGWERTCTVRFLASSAAHTFPCYRVSPWDETRHDSGRVLSTSSPFSHQAKQSMQNSRFDKRQEVLSCLDPKGLLSVQRHETRALHRDSPTPSEREKNRLPTEGNAQGTASENSLIQDQASMPKEPSKIPCPHSSSVVPYAETRSTPHEERELGREQQYTIENQEYSTYEPMRGGRNHEFVHHNEGVHGSRVEEFGPVTNCSPSGTFVNCGNQKGKGFVYVATPDMSGATNIEPLSSGAPESLENHAQMSCHCEANTQRPRSLSLAPTTILDPVDGSTERPAGKIGQARTHRVRVGENGLEPLDLVQELPEPQNIEEHGNTEPEDNTFSPNLISKKLQRPHECINLPQLKLVSGNSDQEPSRKRIRLDGAGSGSVSLLRRKILLELVEECGGAMPHYSDSNPLSSAFRIAWEKANQAGRPDIRTIKATVKSLCQSGCLKQIKFSHRNEKGVMVTKTILAKSDMAVSDQVVLDTQRKMITADPSLYFPEILEIFAKQTREAGGRGQDAHKNVRSKWPAVFEEQRVATASIPALVLRHQLQETLSRARKQRDSAKAALANADGQDHPLDQVEEGHEQRLAEGERAYRRSQRLYKRPNLSRAGYPKRPQQPFSWPLQGLDTGMSFRTELRKPSLTFESLASREEGVDQPTAPARASGSLGTHSAEGSCPTKTTPQMKQGQAVPIVWRKMGHGSILPSSVDDILMTVPERKKKFFRGNDQRYREFAWTVDRVSQWEKVSESLFDSKSNDWNFINLSVGNDFHSAQAFNHPNYRAAFDGLIWFDERGRQRTEKRFHTVEGNGPAHPALEEELAAQSDPPQESEPEVQSEPELQKDPQPQSEQQTSGLRQQTKLLDPQRSGKKRRRKQDSVAGAEPIKKRVRAKSPLTRPQMTTDSAGNTLDISSLIGAKYRRPKGTQHLRAMPEHLVYRLAITIVVVRALAGGLEKHIDWSLVMLVFPDENEEFLRGRWKTLSNKHRREVSQLMDNFQAKFPEAYLSGEAPHVDFDDLQSADWEGLVEWASNNLDKSPRPGEMGDLPATKSELDATLSMKIESSPQVYGDLLGYNQAITGPSKEAAIAAIPFAVPVPPSRLPASHHKPHSHDDEEERRRVGSLLAKSWALSTIATPLDDFNAAEAHRKLQSLASSPQESEAKIEAAIQSLLSSRAVAKKRDKGVDPKGRSYDLSCVFTDMMDQRRSINATMMKQAVRYKIEVLDPTFRKDQPVKFLPVAIEDGDMIAILNLMANGRVRIHPSTNVWSRPDGGGHDRLQQRKPNKFQYQTRKVSREALYFTVLVEHVPDRYKFGNPLLSQGDEHDTPGPPAALYPLPELGCPDHEQDFLPIWRDIHGKIQVYFWDAALAAVLGIVATRPGVGVEEISRMMRPALGEVEVRCLLNWCLMVQAVSRVGGGEVEDKKDVDGCSDGWEVKEWWWMALACARDDSVGDVAMSNSTL